MRAVKISLVHAPFDSPRSLRAEDAYLFRHALLRDAAYQLQMPGDRARLHGLAFAVIEELAGERAPEPEPLESGKEIELSPHATDPFARELAEHALLARTSGEPVGGSPQERDLLGALRIYLRRGAAHADRHFQHGLAERLWREHAELVQGEERGESLRRAANSAGQDDRPLIAERILEQALALAPQSSSRLFEGLVLGNLGAIYLVTGRVEEAEKKFDEALALYREAGHRAQEGIMQGHLAVLYVDTGRVKLAERYYGEALTILRELGNRRSEGIALGNLAGLYHETGRLELAERFYGEALAIHRETGNRRFLGVALGSLASLYGDTGRTELAERSYAEALAIHRGLRNRRFEGAHLCGYALLMMARRRVEAARESWTQGTTIMRNLGDTRAIEALSAQMQNACSKAGIAPLDQGLVGQG